MYAMPWRFDGARSTPQQALAGADCAGVSLGRWWRTLLIGHSVDILPVFMAAPVGPSPNRRQYGRHAPAGCRRHAGDWAVLPDPGAWPAGSAALGLYYEYRPDRAELFQYAERSCCRNGAD